jgi:ferredoxin-NADP reductase
VLGIISATSIGFALYGRLAASATAMIVSLAILLLSAYISDRGLGRWFGIPTNTESWLITALILFLILEPATSISAGLVLALAGAVSSASKFLLAWNGKHIFNPAALAAALLSLTSIGTVTWWVGSSLLWPLTLVLGLAVVQKIRRFPLFITFILVSCLAQVIVFIHAGQPIWPDMKQTLIASPLIFLSTIMLTEPATMPPRRMQQIIFAAVSAVLYVTGWKLGPLIVYPEVALLLGNIFAYVVSPKFRLRLKLKEVQKVSDQVYNYVFLPDRPFKFLAGQYMELTLANVPYDNRGNRRTFTLASSPTEDEVHIGLKYHHPASTWKAAFSDLQPGDIIYASQLAGNFTLPRKNSKMVFIGGGIGITPFRSMVKYLTDTDQASDIVLFYAVSTPQDFAYINEFNAGNKVGIRTVPIITRPGYQIQGTINARLNSKLIERFVPDYMERIFYISGPNIMVHSSKEILQDLGVAKQNIVTDHFSGY